MRDYTRKGFLRGTAVRLPTICVRTGLPNKAASTWASSVVREPLTGVDVVCPVTPETIMVVLSPRKTVNAFLRLHDLPVDAFGPGRTLLLNGINVTARELEQAIGRHAGNRKVGKVIWQHDPAIQKICDGWPQGIRFQASPIARLRDRPRPRRRRAQLHCRRSRRADEAGESGVMGLASRALALGGLLKDDATDGERVAFVSTVILAGLSLWLAPRLPMTDLPQHAAQVATWHDLLLGRSTWEPLLYVNYFTPYLLGYGSALLLSFLVPVRRR